MSRQRTNAFWASTAWILAALFVAMPSEVFTLHWGLGAEKLITDLHAPFIGCLIAVDVFIAYCLGDDRVNSAVRQNSIKMLCTIGGPALLIGCVYKASHEGFWSWISVIGFLIVIVLFLLRFWTYHQIVEVEPFTPIG